MRFARLYLAALAVTAVVATVVACSSDPDPPASKAPFGCCEEATPPRCTRIAYGRAKTSADDACIDARDGAIPDPSAPGWTQEVGADGCKKWVPAPGTKTITCGGGADGGADASGDAASDAPIDASPTPGLYVALCRTVVGASDANDLRFWVDAAVASPASDAGAGEGGADSTLTLVMTPLVGWKAGAPAPPANVTSSLKLGGPSTATSPVSSGVYRAAFGSVTVPADANSISGRELVFSELTLDGTFSGTSKGFCGRLSAKLTQPVALELKGDQNTCLFFPIFDGAPLPEPAAAAFVCP